MLANVKDALAVFDFVTCVVVEEILELPSACFLPHRNQYDGIGLMDHFFPEVRSRYALLTHHVHEFMSV